MLRVEKESDSGYHFEGKALTVSANGLNMSCEEMRSQGLFFILLSFSCYLIYAYITFLKYFIYLLNYCLLAPPTKEAPLREGLLSTATILVPSMESDTQ